MIDIYSYNKEVKEIKDTIEKLEKTVNIDNLKKEIENLEKKTLESNFWDNLDLANNIIKNLNEKKEQLKKFEEILNLCITIEEELELYSLDQESLEALELEKEINIDLKNLKEEYTQFEISMLLNNKYDSSNAILTIHPGAGGTESCDWAQMLYRMYTRYAQKENFQIEVLDLEDGDVAGIKSVSILIKGKNAYGKLKSEHGVHRLVRISPFDSNKRRHTSFASVEVLPEIDEDIQVVVNQEDLKIDYFRASGAGGQHINKTSSAIRITHIPTGIVVTCQNERSQFQNREFAMKMLIAKLTRLEEIKMEQNKKDLRGDVLEIGWASQIRNYVFCPYTLVKDTRTKYEEHNVEQVMDGNIDNFIFEYLKNMIDSK